MFDYSLLEPAYDDGGFLGIVNSDFAGRADYMVAHSLFEVSKIMISVSSVTVCSIFSFVWAGAFSDAMGDVGENFYVGLEDIYNWSIMASIFYAAFFLMRGKIGHSLREFSLTYIIFGLYLAAGLVDSGGFSRFTLDVIEFTGQASGSVAQTTLEGQLDDSVDCQDDHQIVIIDEDFEGGDDDSEDGQHTIQSSYVVSCPFASLIQDIFLERPSDQLNWGTDLDSYADGRCATVRDEIVRDLSRTQGEEARDAMRDSGGECVSRAEYNEANGTNRAPLVIMLVLFILLPMSMIFLFLGFVGLSAQLLLVLTIVALPWALVFGLMPGYGRTVWWRWIGFLFRVVAVFVTLSAFLSIYLVSIRAIVESTQGVNWMFAYMMVTFMTLIMMVALVKLLRGAKGASQLSGARLSQLTQGDPAVWLPDVAGGYSNTVYSPGAANVYGGFRAYNDRRRARRGPGRGGGGPGGGVTRIRRQKIVNRNRIKVRYKRR